jgi:hypothetical protein
MSTPPGPAPPPGGPNPSGSHWQHLPPEQLARMHQPGVVPLRPLTLGDIFVGALQTMRRNPEATLGMGLLVLAVFLVPSLLGSLALTRLVTLAELDRAAATAGINALMAMISSVALTGMIVFVVSEAVLGDRVGLGATWGAVRGRLLALIGTIVLLSLLTVVVIALPVLAVVALVLAVETTGGGVGVTILVTILLMLGLLVFLLWAGCRVSLAPAPVVLERVGPWRGIVRAWRLTTGVQAWRIVGITVLAGVVTAVFSGAVQVPVVFASTVALESAGVDTGPVAPATLAVDHLAQLVVGAVTIPFTAGVTALLYLDQRIRREGLDVILVRAAGDRAAARTR